MEATLYAKIIAILISTSTQMRQPSPTVVQMEQFTAKDGSSIIITHKPVTCTYGDGTPTTCTGK